MYDPQVGRFVSEDPTGFEAGDANLFRYVGNAPTTFVDPDGLKKGKSGSKNSGEIVKKLPNSPRFWLIVATSFNSGARGALRYAGHAWIAIADSVSDTMIARGLQPTKGVSARNDKCPGKVADESKTQFTIARAYPISATQFRHLKALIENEAKRPPQYDFQDNNCTTWSVKVMRTVGLGRGVPKSSIILGGASNDIDKPDYTPAGLGDFLLRDKKKNSILFDNR